MAAAFRHLEYAADADLMLDFFTSRVHRLGVDTDQLISCYIPRVFPRKDNTFAIQYELHLKARDGRSKERLLLYGLLSAALGEAREVRAGYDLTQCLQHPELSLIVPVLPFDPGLPGLVDFWDTASANDRLTHLPSVKNDWHFNGSIVSRTMLGYRIERRCTFSYLCSRASFSDPSDSRFELVAKIVPPRKIARILHTMENIQRHGFSGGNPDGFTTPAVLGSDVNSGAIIMEKSPGRVLHEFVGHADFPTACAAAGRMLRRFHNLPDLTPDSVAHTVDDELADLSWRVRLLCTIFPYCASNVQKAYHMLTAHAVPDIPTADVGLVHRDFHDKQVLFTKGRTTLLDYDNASPGDPAQDVGNFLAHLDLRRLQHPEAGRQITSAGEMFMESYGRGDEPFARRVDWWRAVTLMRLASLYAIRPRWRHLTLELAEQCQLRVGAGTHVTKGV